MQQWTARCAHLKVKPSHVTHLKVPKAHVLQLVGHAQPLHRVDVALVAAEDLTAARNHLCHM